MKNNIKKTILTLIAIITLMSTAAVLPTYAALPDTGGTVEPMWDNTAAINISMLFDENNYGYSEATVLGYDGVTKIIAEVIVYRQIGSAWIQVAEKQTTTNGRVCGISCQFSAVSGAYYKSVYTFTVTKNNVSETITKTKTSTCE